VTTIRIIQNFTLAENSNIDAIGDDVFNALIKIKIERKTALKAKLYCETILLDLFAKSIYDIKLEISKQFLSTNFKFQYGGELFNPLVDDANDEDDDKLNQLLMCNFSNISATHKYARWTTL